MTVMVAVATCKGSPGATTVALGLAACWPEGGLLVEADPHGGDLGDRFGYAAPPGMVSAAAVARHGTGPGWLTEHLQRLPLGVEVLLGGHNAESAATAVASLAHDQLRRHGAPAVIVDVGRLGTSPVALPLVVAADLVLVVVRPELADLRHVANGLMRLPAPVRQRTRLVLAGRGRFGPREITRDLGIQVAATVPDDRWGAAVLAGRTGPVRGWRRLRAPRLLAELATQLATASQKGAGSVERVASEGVGGREGEQRAAKARVS